MTSQVHTNHVSLKTQTIHIRVVLNVNHLKRVLSALSSKREQVHAVVDHLTTISQHTWNRLNHLAPVRLKIVKRASHSQVDKHVLLSDTSHHATRHSILNRREPASTVTFLDDDLSTGLRHTLDTRETVQDLKPRLTRVVRRHTNVRQVDVHGTHRDTHTTSLTQVVESLVLLVNRLSNQSSNELNRIMRLQIGSLISVHGIGDTVRLIEGIL